jgi:VRR-NUC domain
MTDPLFGKRPKDTELEKDFQERVCQLAVLLGWRIYSIPDSRRATVAGWPDLTMWHPKRGAFLMAELKRETGRLSEAQKVVIDELRACGVNVHVWRPSDFETTIVPLLKGSDQ